MGHTPLQPVDRSTICPDANLLASFVEGRTSLEERAFVEAHIARCEDCYFVFSETLREQQSSGNTGWRSWIPKAAAGLAAAAALILVVSAGYFYRSASDLTAALGALDAAGGPYRKFESRLTILPTHYELEPAIRSSAPSREAPLAVREAAAVVEQAAGSGTSVEERQALAAAYLVQGQRARAVEVLTPLEGSAQQPALLNDIAAAYLSRAADGDAKRAFDLLERAVSLEPGRVEAWFNLGLAAEAIGNAARAREAWTQYLEIDQSSAWAAEARRHLSKPNR